MTDTPEIRSRRAKSSRTKGQHWERVMARMLTERFGVKFERVLRQYQAKNLCDLRTQVPSSFDHVFIEIKYRSYPPTKNWFPAQVRKYGAAAIESGYEHLLFCLKVSHHDWRCWVGHAGVAAVLPAAYTDVLTVEQAFSYLQELQYE